MTGPIQSHHDVLVLGGGPAGLQAALTLGRMHRSTLLVDSGEPRNAAAARMHNVVTHDGTPPEQFRSTALDQLAAYADVERRDARVEQVVAGVDGFAVTTDDGTTHEARRLVLATGVRDVLPDVPGLAGLWGSVVAHCPYCHGHELAGGTVAVQGGPHATRLALLMARIAGRVLVLADAHDLSRDEADLLAAHGIPVETGRITALEPDGTGARVRLDDGSAQRVDGFLVASSPVQAAPFAAQLGLRMLPSGGIEVDQFGRTSLAGVYAAGDLAHVPELPMAMASVLTAAAAGLTAAATCHQDLLTEEVARAGAAAPVA